MTAVRRCPGPGLLCGLAEDRDAGKGRRTLTWMVGGSREKRTARRAPEPGEEKARSPRGLRVHVTHPKEGAGGYASVYTNGSHPGSCWLISSPGRTSVLSVIWAPDGFTTP